MTRSPARGDLLIAAALAASVLVALLATVEGVGFTRDEGYYFRAADLYRGWLGEAWQHVREGRLGEATSDPPIVRAFGYNTEHPVLLKTLFGLSWKLFHDELGWVRDSTGYRLPAMLLAAAMIGLVYLFATEACSRRVGLGAAALLATLPRLFHDAHLACFDVPMAAMQLAVTYAYWRSLRRPRWAVVTGVLFGLALATKLNAFFVPLFLGAHAVARAVRHRFVPPPEDEPPAFLPFLAMAALAPPVFLAHWPYLWHDTLARFGTYLQFHLHHEHYPVEYFGRVLVAPPFPWSFVFVMTAVTVPLPTLTLMAAAVARGVIREIARLGGWPAADDEVEDGRLTRLLLLLSGLGPMLVMTLPGVPIFGGVKHWFTAMPFLAILAAAELDRVVAWALGAVRLSPRGALLGQAAAVLAVILPGLLGIRLVHPYGIGFYNELIGSVRGGAEHGMLRNFWGYTSRGNLAYLDRRAEPASRVFFHRTNPDSYAMDRREGLLRSDLTYAWRVEDADWGTFDQQRPYAEDEYRAWNLWGTTRPLTGVYVDEVPMNLVYRRPRAGD